MMRTCIWLVLCSIFWCNVVESANILAIFPIPVRSHYVMSKTILKGLAAEGHDIDLYTSFPDENIAPRIHHHQIPNLTLLETPLSVTDLRAISVAGMIELMFTVDGNGHSVCEKCFNSDTLKALKQSKKLYDLVLLELFVIDCLFGFSHLFRAPVVALTSSVDLPWGSHRIGNLDNPSYIPTYLGQFSSDMTIYGRVLNTFHLLYAKYRHYVHLDYQEKMAKQFFGDTLPPLDEIVSNTSLIMVNSHFSLNVPRPTVPNFVEIAGIHIGEPKQVSQDIADIIGNDKFIYFSFGSIVGSESIPLEKLQYILHVLGEKHKVLWKADKNKIAKGLVVPKTVHPIPWLPQLDILCHPNIEFFLSHSGLMSTQEAVYCGVPMLSVPMFADQFLNANNNINKGIGLTLDIESSSKEDINRVIQELIDNPIYKKNAKNLSRIFKDRPTKPLDEAIYWIEYVLKYEGAPQLRSPSADLPWYQYYLVDIGIIIGISILCITYIVDKLILLVCRKVIKNKEKSQ